MKKVFLAFMMVLSLSVMFVSCDKSTAKKMLLKQEIEKAQRQMPIKLGVIGEITNITYENDNVTFSYLVDEKFTDKSIFEGDLNVVKDNFVCVMVRNSSTRKLVSAIVDAKASLTFSYKGKKTGKTASVTVSNEELANADNLDISAEKAAQMLIDNTVNSERSNMPVNLEPGVSITDSFWEGNVLVYVITMDGKMFSVNILDSLDKDALRTASKNQLKSSPSVQSFIQAMVALNKTITYRYQVEGHDKHIDVTFSNVDMKDVLSINN
jgi:hypothetical protein